MISVRCPYCIKPIEANSSDRCSSCAEPLPQDFIAKQRKSPAAWICSVGYSLHGKTSFLGAMALTLQNLGRVIPNFYCTYDDEFTCQSIREMHQGAKRGEQPHATQRGPIRPLILGIHNLPTPSGETSDHALLFYDAAGEMFTSVNEAHQELKALSEVKTVWLFVSAEDLKHDAEGNTLPALFQSYRVAMNKLGVGIVGLTAVIVYTKADQVEFHDSAIDQYLADDPFRDITVDATSPVADKFEPTQYHAGMEAISNRLEDYTRQHVAGGATLINMVRGCSMQLRFCVTSALGQTPAHSTNRLTLGVTRHRVLDPLLWACWSQSLVTHRLGRSLLRLVVDSTENSQPVYQGALHRKIWEKLSEIGETATFYLGSSSPVSHGNQAPPQGPDRRSRLRLIGPILERLKPESRLLVLTNGPILDLGDFRQSQWRDRLLVVTTDQSYEDAWPHTYVFRLTDDPALAVNLLLSLEDIKSDEELY